MELLIMFAIGAAVLGLIWLIVREPVKVIVREAKVSEELFRPQPVVTPVSAFAIEMAKAETAQEARVNAGIPRAPMPEVKKPKPEKHVDKPAPRSYSSSSSRSSSGGSSYSSRSDDSYSSYSSSCCS